MWNLSSKDWVTLLIPTGYPHIEKILINRALDADSAHGSYDPLKGRWGRQELQGFNRIASFMPKASAILIRVDT